MIEFKCQHCGKALHLNDTYAGRDGWCRVCKRMVIVPDGGVVRRVEDLPPEEGYERLQRLLQYAATKADKFKIHLAGEAQEESRVARLTEQLRQAEAALAVRAGECTRLRDEFRAAVEAREEAERSAAAWEARFAGEGGAEPEPARAAELEALRARLAERDGEVTRLEALLAEREGEVAAAAAHTEELTALRAQVSALESAAVGREGALAKSKAALEHARALLAEREGALAEAQAVRAGETGEALAGLTAERDEALARCASQAVEVSALREEVARLGEVEGRLAASEVAQRALEGAVTSLKAQLLQVETERDRLARALDSEASGQQEHAGLLMEKEREVSALTARLEDLKARQLEADRVTRGQIEALESQVTVFNELKERLGNLQGRIRELEQERLDGALTLDAARQAEALAQRRIEALESAARELGEERAARAIHEEQLARELAVRDEQLRQVQAELTNLSGAQGSAALDLQKLARSARAAEEQTERLGGELAALQEEKGRTEVECTRLRGEVSGLERRVAVLGESLAAAEANAAEVAPLRQSEESLRAEMSALRGSLARLESERLSSEGAQSGAVAALQAEVMNLSEALDQAEARAVAAESRASAQAAELAQRDEALAGLKSAYDALAASQVAPASGGAGSGGRAPAAGGEPAAEAEAGGDPGVEFILLEPEEEFPGGGNLNELADQQRRQKEKQEMLDALSDFLKN